MSQVENSLHGMETIGLHDREQEGPHQNDAERVLNRGLTSSIGGRAETKRDEEP